MKRSVQNMFATFSILNATIFTILALGILYAIFFAGCASSPKIKDYEGGPKVSIREDVVRLGNRPKNLQENDYRILAVRKVATVKNSFNFPVEVLVDCPSTRRWIKVNRSSSHQIFFNASVQRQYENHCRVKAGRVSHR